MRAEHADGRSITIDLPPPSPARSSLALPNGRSQLPRAGPSRPSQNGVDVRGDLRQQPPRLQILRLRPRHTLNRHNRLARPVLPRPHHALEQIRPPVRVQQPRAPKQRVALRDRRRLPRLEREPRQLLLRPRRALLHHEPSTGGERYSGKQDANHAAANAGSGARAGPPWQYRRHALPTPAAMSDPNVFEPEWEPGTPPGLRGVRVAAAAGAHELGVTLYEIAPGAAVSPYHVHHANEELLVVLSGRPRLRTPEGERELAPGRGDRVPARSRRRAPGDEPRRRAGPRPARLDDELPGGRRVPDTGALLTMTGPATAGRSRPTPSGRSSSSTAKRWAHEHLVVAEARLEPVRGGEVVVERASSRTAGRAGSAPAERTPAPSSARSTGCARAARRRSAPAPRAWPAAARRDAGRSAARRGSAAAGSRTSRGPTRRGAT